MILCCGEALIDMIPVDLTVGGRAFVPHAGGAVFNTAIALGRLGVAAGMLSGVSTDAFGRLLAGKLAEDGVATDMLIRSDRLTTLAMVHIEAGHATYSFYDENSAGRMLNASDMPEIPGDVTALFFGGISLVSAPAADAYAALLARAGGTRVVMLDPNIRPGFITDETAYRARLERMLGQSDIVKVSDEDLRWITGGEGSVDAQADRLRDQGPRFVIVTKGTEGAVAFGPDGQTSVAAAPAKVVDTVGAGDTFNAGVLAGLEREGRLTRAALEAMTAEDFRPALALGAKVAAVTVSRAGANPPRAGEIGLG